MRGGASGKQRGAPQALSGVKLAIPSKHWGSTQPWRGSTSERHIPSFHIRPRKLRAGRPDESPAHLFISGLRDITSFVSQGGHQASEGKDKILASHCNRCFTFTKHMPVVQKDRAYESRFTDVEPEAPPQSLIMCQRSHRWILTAVEPDPWFELG